MYRSALSSDECPIRTNWELHQLKVARRLNGPIYDVLIMELREENCPKTAKYFELLVEIEKDLITSRQVQVPVSNDNHFLMMMYDNVREAELITKRENVPNAKAKSLTLLIQTINLVDAYKKTYGWLLPRFYEIVCGIMEKVPPGDLPCLEIKSKFLFKYGSFLANENRLSAVAINALVEALDLARGQGWKFDTLPFGIENKSLEEAIVRKLVLARLNYGYDMLYTLPNYCIASCEEAIQTLQNSDYEKNKDHLIEALMLKIDGLMQVKSYGIAVKDIDTVEKLLEKENALDFAYARCLIAKYKAQCYLGFENQDGALDAFEKANEMCITHKFPNLQAECCTEIANIKAKNGTQEENQVDAREYEIKPSSICVQ